MSDRSIRLAEQSDLPILVCLYHEFHTFHVRGLPMWLREPDARDERLKAAIEDILANDSAAILVATVDGVVVGLAEMYLRQDEPDPAVVPYRYCYLQSLFVSACWRGQGLGAALLDRAQQWAAAKGAAHMLLSTWEFAEGPLRFYEKLGYQTVKRTLAINLQP